MSTASIEAVDEGRHAPGAEELWGESWYLDFAAADSAFGGYVRLGLYPNLGVTWLWVHLTGIGRPLVFLRDHALPCAEGAAALSPTREGLRASYAAPEPLERVRVEVDAAGLRVDDPAEAFREGRGERVGSAVAVSLELDWVSRGPAFPYAMTTRYEQSTWVTGEVRIADEAIPVSCAGQRDHSWGVRDWWLFPWNWTAGHLDDGTFFHAARSIIPNVELFGTGYVIAPDGSVREVASEEIEVQVDTDEDSLPISARQRVGPLRFTTEPVGNAPLLLVSPEGREARFPRAQCRFTTEDGRRGTGWTEYNWPPRWPR